MSQVHQMPQMPNQMSMPPACGPQMAHVSEPALGSSEAWLMGWGRVAESFLSWGFLKKNTGENRYFLKQVTTYNFEKSQDATEQPKVQIPRFFETQLNCWELRGFKF